MDHAGRAEAFMGRIGGKNHAGRAEANTGRRWGRYKSHSHFAFGKVRRAIPSKRTHIPHSRLAFHFNRRKIAQSNHRIALKSQAKERKRLEREKRHKKLPSWKKVLTGVDQLLIKGISLNMNKGLMKKNENDEKLLELVKHMEKNDISFACLQETGVESAGGSAPAGKNGDNFTLLYKGKNNIKRALVVEE